MTDSQEPDPHEPDPTDDTGVSLDPEGDGARSESTADRDADDADAVLPGEGDDAGLASMSIDDVDEP